MKHSEVLTVLKELEPYYQTDVTQPFGLGTKLSRTYVTRCLLGERGTTYKYLGLRMFSTDWNGAAGGGVKMLNDGMEERLGEHLDLLEENRNRLVRRGDVEGFNVALINRMESYAPRGGSDKSAAGRLKLEPTFGEDRVSVSWHADR